MLTSKQRIIAIDGYSSSGKSSLAKAIAHRLDYLYIDTGAMYRAFTYACIQENCFIDNYQVDHQKLNKILNTISIKFIKNNDTGEYETYLDGSFIEEEIRNMEVANKVSIISKIPEVRTKMVELQRQFAEHNSVVMNGRDIGNVVFPDADLEIFLTAPVEVRAHRRHKELLEHGIKIHYEEIRKNIEERDHLDETRDLSPLKQAEDAIVLDNTHLTLEDEIEWILHYLKEKSS